MFTKYWDMNANLKSLEKSKAESFFERFRKNSAMKKKPVQDKLLIQILPPNSTYCRFSILKNDTKYKKTLLQKTSLKFLFEIAFYFWWKIFGFRALTLW